MITIVSSLAYFQRLRHDVTINPVMTHNNIVPTALYSNINKINIDMIEKNNEIKNNNIIIYSSEATHKQIRNWMSYVADIDYDVPGFVSSNLANNLIYSKQHTNKNDLYVAYKPKSHEEALYIACLKINEPQRKLSIKQICTNPNINTSLISLFKRELIIMSKKYGTTLDFKPLSRLVDKRQYYNFIYFR